ncbi:MAG: hypothetical protein OES13_00685 [Acidimicrobiia bacterium]|nr:hypothetical protein [Acidimicrobiia bacterium]
MKTTITAAVVLALTIVSVGPAAAATHTDELAAVAHAKASAADIALWNGRAEAYAAIIAEAYAAIITLDLTGARNADIARWNGRAEAYATSITLDLTRARNADIARWNGRAEAYATILSA